MWQHVSMIDRSFKAMPLASCKQKGCVSTRMKRAFTKKLPGLVSQQISHLTVDDIIEVTCIPRAKDDQQIGDLHVNETFALSIVTPSGIQFNVNFESHEITLTRKQHNETVQPRVVFSYGEFIEIVGPLNPGDRLVSEGNERLRPEQQVKVLETPAGGPPEGTARKPSRAKTPS